MRFASAVAVAFLLAVFLPAGTASAGEYVVQIGAFRQPSDAFGAAAEPFGEVSTRRTRSGLTLFEVGGFDSLAEARRAQAELRAAGYPGAFARRAAGAVARARSAQVPAVSAAAEARRAPRQEPRSRFDRLPMDVRVRTVYLDGKLHVKEGDRFIPLEEYEGGRYR